MTIVWTVVRFLVGCVAGTFLAYAATVMAHEMVSSGPPSSGCGGGDGWGWLAYFVLGAIGCGLLGGGLFAFPPRSGFTTCTVVGVTLVVALVMRGVAGGVDNAFALAVAYGIASGFLVLASYVLGLLLGRLRSDVASGDETGRVARRGEGA